MAQKLILLIFPLLISHIFNLECIGSGSQSIGWFTAIKFPDKVINDTGKFYAYYSADEYKNGASDFIYSSNSLTDQSEPVYKTLKSTDKSGIVTFAWNDEIPENSSLTNDECGHTKGVLSFDLDDQTGFYLGHSQPKYPRIFSNNTINPELDPTDLTYGQSFFCLSLDLDAIEKLADNLLLINANIYFTANVDTLSKHKSSYPNLYNFATKNLNEDTATKQLEIQTQIDQISIQVFSKSYKQSLNMFSDLLIPNLQTSFFAETWGRPLKPNVCNVDSKYNSQSIRYLKFTNDIYYEYSEDHSKIAISQAINDQHLTCLGDINRMTSQDKRGGSYFCFNLTPMWNLYYSKILTINSQYYEQSNTSSACKDDCLESSQLQYFSSDEVAGSKCVLCSQAMQNCFECTSSTSCSKCAESYVLSSSKSSCSTSCLRNEYLDETENLCKIKVGDQKFMGEFQ